MKKLPFHISAGAVGGVAVLGLSAVFFVTLFGDNIKALFGMSADSLAGDTLVQRRTSSYPKLEKKRLTNFATENGGYDAPSVYVPPPSPTVQTARDARSTFAIDVDTASYTYARRMLLTQRSLPAADMVRVEEWVNAFDYELRAPQREPFAISVDGASSPFDETKTLLRVALQGRRVDEEQRKPAHLVFLVDVSGSMDGADRLPLAKRSLEVLTRQLRPSDTVALVTYAGRAEVVLPPTKADRQSQILNAISSLTTGGGTSMGSGMELAYDLAVGQVRPHTTTRVIVLTDGDANIGPNLTPDQMLAAVAGHVAEGVTLTTVGFGLGNYRGNELERLADKGNGQALYVDGEEAIDRSFRKGLLGTLELIAKDVKVQVTFDPKVVSSYRLVGYENRDIADDDFKNDKVDAGELGSGHAVTALYEVTLTSAGGPLGSVAVRGQLPDSNEVFEVTEEISRASVSQALSESSGELRFASAVALGAELLRGNAVKGWGLEEIIELARGASADKVDRLEFVSMMQMARGMTPSKTVARVNSYDGY